MSEKEAWKKIRDAFQNYADMATDDYLSRAGICHAISTMHYDGEIPFGVFCSMSDKMVKPEGAHRGLWWWPITRDGARERVKFIDGILKKL